MWPKTQSKSLSKQVKNECLMLDLNYQEKKEHFQVLPTYVTQIWLIMAMRLIIRVDDGDDCPAWLSPWQHTQKGAFDHAKPLWQAENENVLLPLPPPPLPAHSLVRSFARSLSPEGSTDLTHLKTATNGPFHPHLSVCRCRCQQAHNTLIWLIKSSVLRPPGPH